MYGIVAYRFGVAVGITRMVEEARNVPLLRPVDESPFVEAHNIILREEGGRRTGNGKTKRGVVALNVLKIYLVKPTQLSALPAETHQPLQ